MIYNIYVTRKAEVMFDSLIHYLIFEKNNKQAARSLIDDFENTKTTLQSVAESLQFCENSRLRNMGYRRINFGSHRYFMLYRVLDNNVYIEAIFHELQDYESKIM